jgi:hypothetical protein
MQSITVWVLDLHTLLTAVYCLWPDTLRRYMNEARKYCIQYAGLQELIKRFVLLAQSG